jgi:putative tryptophan/tyrosine transport system ATP-binding protein
MLEILHISKEFRDNGVARSALRDINLRVGHGEILAVLGPNGAGKSTLGNILTQDVASEGSVLLDGIDITAMPVHRRSGLVARLTQNPSASLSDAISIGEHFVLAKSMGRRRSSWFGMSRAIRQEARARLAALRSGLEERVDDSVATLSGGERQLVALSLLTASAPKALVLDEPTSALDLSARTALHRVALELIEAQSLATIWITHDLDEALKVADRLILMAGGRIVHEFSGDRFQELTCTRLAQLMSQLIMDRIEPERNAPISSINVAAPALVLEAKDS